MVLDCPDDFFAQIWPQDFGGEPVMVLRRQSVADIMEEGAYNPVYIGAIAIGPRGACSPCSSRLIL